MSFYITLPSNVVSQQFADNTIANYLTILNQRISLEGQWNVGLSEISYTKSWYNVLDSHKIMLFDELGNIFEAGLYTENKEVHSNSLSISSGFYESADELIKHINLE